MRTVLAGIVVCLCLAPGVEAQNSTIPAFEVASVRMNRSGTGGASIDFSPVGLTARNYPLGGLIMFAYELTQQQISSESALLADKYDIAAKSGHEVTRDELKRMLQGLFEDRFKLAIRRDRTEAAVYALVVARGGPKFGKTFQPTQAAGNAQRKARLGSNGKMILENTSMADLAFSLSRFLPDRPTVDKTGLVGLYDFEMSLPPPATGRPEGADSPSGERPSFDVFSDILQQQLGLKLAAEKSTVEIVKIEHVERPSEN